MDSFRGSIVHSLAICEENMRKNPTRTQWRNKSEMKGKPVRAKERCLLFVGQRVNRVLLRRLECRIQRAGNRTDDRNQSGADDPSAIHYHLHERKPMGEAHFNTPTKRL